MPQDVAMGQGFSRFLKRCPTLYHVTRVDAVDSIMASGLKSARRLREESGAIADAPKNRMMWTKLPNAWLRWQGMRDEVLASRLPPETAPADWRAFIDGMVFLFPSLGRAQALASYPRDREVEQVVLRVDTKALIQSGADIRICRWNNGFADRSRPPRLKSFADYVRAAAWESGDISEVTVVGNVPSSVLRARNVVNDATVPTR